MAGRYISQEDVRIETQLDSDQFGDVEIAMLLVEVKQAEHAVLFDITTGGSVFSAPIVHEGRFYCGCCDHNFYCLDAETGRELWKFPTGDVINLDAVLDSGIVYFGSYDKNLYALDLEGKLVWKFQSGGEMGIPVIHKGVIYVGSRDGNIYALDSKTGKELWRFRTNGPTPGQPTVHGDTVYFGSWDHHVYALSLDGKRLRWKFQAKGLVGGVRIYKDRAFFGSFDHHIYSTDLNGNLVWKHQLPVKMYSVSKPIISEDVIYVGLFDDHMYAIKINDGVLWKYRTGNMIATDPMVHGDTVYFGSCDGCFYSLDKMSGNLRWKFQTTLPMVAPPVVENGRIYFGGGDCNFYCLGLDGKVLWKTPTSLSYPAWVNMEEAGPQKSAEVVWHIPDSKETDRYLSDGIQLADYGEFSGRYIDVTKSNYLGSSKKGYMKKPD